MGTRNCEMRLGCVDRRGGLPLARARQNVCSGCFGARCFVRARERAPLAMPPGSGRGDVVRPELRRMRGCLSARAAKDLRCCSVFGARSATRAPYPRSMQRVAATAFRRGGREPRRRRPPRVQASHDTKKRTREQLRD